jgi:hypothetical protein
MLVLSIVHCVLTFEIGMVFCGVLDRKFVVMVLVEFVVELVEINKISEICVRKEIMFSLFTIEMLISSNAVVIWRHCPCIAQHAVHYVILDVREVSLYQMCCVDGLHFKLLAHY